MNRSPTVPLNICLNENRFSHVSYSSDWTYLFMILSNKAIGDFQIQPIQIRESLV